MLSYWQLCYTKLFPHNLLNVQCYFKYSLIYKNYSTSPSLSPVLAIFPKTAKLLLHTYLLYLCVDRHPLTVDMYLPLPPITGNTPSITICPIRAYLNDTTSAKLLSCRVAHLPSSCCIDCISILCSTCITVLLISINKDI